MVQMGHHPCPARQQNNNRT